MMARTPAAGDIVGILDLGTSKAVCLVAVIEPRGASASARVIGVGHCRSRGVKSGVITDLEEAEQAVRLAVSQAERMAGSRIEAVHVAMTCGRLGSEGFTASADVETGIVSHNDVARVTAGARAYAERHGRTLIELHRAGYRLDGVNGARDPRGMAAQRLAADVVAITADEAPLRNLLLVVERCYLSALGLYAAPFAGGLAVTTEEERRLGVTVIDLGAGTTTIAAFAGGHLAHVDAIPFGGDHLTFDIARALQTPLAEAERIKVLYGTLLPAQSDEREAVVYPPAGAEDGVTFTTSKAFVGEIVRMRTARLGDLIAERLDADRCRPFAGQHVVVTGGGSGLVGMADYLGERLGRAVRAGRPQQIAGLPAQIDSPAFACAAGLFVAAAGGGGVTQYASGQRQAAGYLGRVGQWLKDGF